tara:strand:- start:901 stop:1131 length:231 start_codon:yes stop_codon:yes gene_type:complete
MKNKHNKKTNPKKPLNKALQLSGAGIQMGGTIYFGFLLGKWLDKNLGINFLEEIVTLLAIFLAMYSLIKQANKIND